MKLKKFTFICLNDVIDLDTIFHKLSNINVIILGFSGEREWTFFVFIYIYIYFFSFFSLQQSYLWLPSCVTHQLFHISLVTRIFCASNFYCDMIAWSEIFLQTYDWITVAPMFHQNYLFFWEEVILRNVGIKSMCTFIVAHWELGFSRIILPLTSSAL